MRTSYVCTLGVAMLWLTATAHAEIQAAPTADVIQARWDVRDVEFTYTGITTAYSCSALEEKVYDIVRAVGGHPTTAVRTNGCQADRPTRTIFVRITTAMPRPVSEPQSSAVIEREKLLARMGVQKGFQGEVFPASQQNLQLSDERRLRLDAGDCELMTELKEEVFPKLGVLVTADNLNCIPGRVGIGKPRISVTALVPRSDASAADSNKQ